MNITIRGLSHQFKVNGRLLPVLRDINLNIAAGEFVALVGPSGCGKSTLLRILAHLLTPTSGLVDIGGADPATAVAHKRIAWMAQNPALLPWYTTHDNIALVQRINGTNHHTPADLLALVGLSDFADAHPFTLSGGMQQRLALARILAQQAAVWLMRFSSAWRVTSWSGVMVFTAVSKTCPSRASSAPKGWSPLAAACRANA